MWARIYGSRFNDLLLTNVPRRLDPPPPETHPRTLYVSRASFIQATCVLRPRRPGCVLAANRRFTGFTRGGCGYKRCDPNVCASVPCAWPDSRVTSYEGNPPTKLPSFQNTRNTPVPKSRSIKRHSRVLDEGSSPLGILTWSTSLVPIKTKQNKKTHPSHQMADLEEAEHVGRNGIKRNYLDGYEVTRPAVRWFLLWCIFFSDYAVTNQEQNQCSTPRENSRRRECPACLLKLWTREGRTAEKPNTWSAVNTHKAAHWNNHIIQSIHRTPINTAPHLTKAASAPQQPPTTAPESAPHLPVAPD